MEDGVDVGAVEVVVFDGFEEVVFVLVVDELEAAEVLVVRDVGGFGLAVAAEVVSPIGAENTTARRMLTLLVSAKQYTTLCAPADCPASVMFSASPPKKLM